MSPPSGGPRGLQLQELPVVLLQQVQASVLLEDCAQGLVLSAEAKPHEAVPLSEVDLDGRVPRLDSHHAALHLRRGLEVVLADLEKVADPCKELRVHRQPAVQGLTGLGHQPHGKLALEHQDGSAEQGPVAQELEGQRRGDLIGRVGYADVEVREIMLQHVSLNDLKLARLWGPLEPTLELENHAGVHLVRYHLLGNFQELCGQVSRSRSDLQDHVRRLDACADVWEGSGMVVVSHRLSRARHRESNARYSPAFWTMDSIMCGFFNMCWPLDLWNSIPVAFARVTLPLPCCEETAKRGSVSLRVGRLSRDKKPHLLNTGRRHAQGGGHHGPSPVPPAPFPLLSRPTAAASCRLLVYAVFRRKSLKDRK